MWRLFPEQQTEKDPANHALSPASRPGRLADAGQLLHGTVTPKSWFVSADLRPGICLTPAEGARIIVSACQRCCQHSLRHYSAGQATAELSPLMERHGCIWAHHCPSLAFATAKAVLLTAALAPTAAEVICCQKVRPATALGAGTPQTCSCCGNGWGAAAGPTPDAPPRTGYGAAICSGTCVQSGSEDQHELLERLMM